MNKLKAELDEMRDELSDELYKSYSKNNGHFNAERFSDGYEEGFNAATDILLPKLEKCRAALKEIRDSTAGENFPGFPDCEKDLCDEWSSVAIERRKVARETLKEVFGG